MSGVILETLNIRKLLMFAILMALLQITFFLIGGLIAPSPNTADNFYFTLCVDRSGDSSKWHYIRKADNFSCQEILEDGDLEEVVPSDVTAEQLVFIVQIPHARSGIQLTMTRWFQQLIGVLMVDIKNNVEKEMDKNAEITLDLRLGYRNRGDPNHMWHELARSTEVRPLQCKLNATGRMAPTHDHMFLEKDYFSYDCEVMPLFTLASCHHDEYLLNLRIPTNYGQTGNVDIGMIRELTMAEIHQNGGFTKVWFAVKTTVFPFGVLALIFFLSRVRELNRPATVLEKIIMVLGIGLSLLNFPIEWLSLFLNAPFWLVLSDLRQGLFYAILVCFWLIFTAEHMMDGSEDRASTGCGATNLSGKYWPRLLLVGGACTALLIFELSERGVQMKNPFYSIWSHPVATKMAIASLFAGAVCSVLYFVYLVYLFVRTLIQLLSKRRLLTSFPVEQRRYYAGVIYRFTVFLFYTIVCAALTVAFFIFSRVTEDQWSWGERTVEYTSAFIVGVYGMWNVYVISILCLYAPSHKFRSRAGQELYARLVSGTHSSADVASSYGGHESEIRFLSQNKNDHQVESIKLVRRADDQGAPVPTRSNSSDRPSALSFLRKDALE